MDADGLPIVGPGINLAEVSSLSAFTSILWNYFPNLTVKCVNCVLMAGVS